jgi:hypothetical protein
MTEGEAGPDRRRQERLLAGKIFCLAGLLLAIGQVVATLYGAGANATASILGIGFCILGYYLDSRKLATATVVLCVVSILFGLAASQGLVPGIAPSERTFPDLSFRF